MAPKAREENGESSTAAAKKALTAKANGVTNYELPWYAFHILLSSSHDLIISGSRNTDQSSWTMS